MKTSWRRLSSLSSEDVLIKTNMFTLALCLQKTSSRRLQDVLVKTNIFVLAIRLQDVFKTFSRRLQDVLQKRLQDIFKTSCKDVFKTFSRRIIRLNCLPRSRICLGHTFEKFMVTVENLCTFTQICLLICHFTISLVAAYTGVFRT